MYLGVISYKVCIYTTFVVCRGCLLPYFWVNQHNSLPQFASTIDHADWSVWLIATSQILPKIVQTKVSFFSLKFLYYKKRYNQEIIPFVKTRYLWVHERHNWKNYYWSVNFLQSVCYYKVVNIKNKTILNIYYLY